MKIVNEASVLQGSAVKIVDGCVPVRLVIRKIEGYHPFSTHKEEMSVVGNDVVHSSFYDGRYFHSLEEALDDFNERTSRAYSL